MLVIRFLRTGKRNQPSFKIVVNDKRRSASGGRFVEEVGFWSPLTKVKILKGERIKYWLSKGAEPSASVYNLLVKEKVIEGKKIPVHKKKKGKGLTSSVPLASGSLATELGRSPTVGKKEEKQEASSGKEEKNEGAKEEPKKEEKPASNAAGS